MKQLRHFVNRALVNMVLATTVLTSRLGFFPANVSPVGSFGFFGHPLWFGATILVFDIGVKGVYPGFLWTYLGFAMYPLLGKLTRKHSSAQLLAIPTASLLFFLLSNFGVWWYWYDHTWTQLLMCYTVAIPFYARTLVGDMSFGYGYWLYQHRQHMMKTMQAWHGDGPHAIYAS